MRRGIIGRGEKTWERERERERIGEGKEIGERRIIEWGVEKIKWNKWEKKKKWEKEKIGEPKKQNHEIMEINKLN